MTDRPLAYVCSPYKGDIEANTDRARFYCRQVYEAGYIPLAPHLLFPQFLSESVPEEREAGLEMGIQLLAGCRTLVVCGDEVTEGMAREIKHAERLRVPVLTLDVFLPETARERIPAPGKAMPEKPSVLNQIAAARENRAASEPSGKERPKSHEPEL